MISFFLGLISLSWKAVHYSRALTVLVLTSEDNPNELNNCFPLILTKHLFQLHVTYASIGLGLIKIVYSVL